MKKINAVVTSVVPLTAKQVQQLTQAIEQQYPASAVELTQLLDPTLLGGLKVKVAGKLVDASAASMLQQLAKQL